MIDVDSITLSLGETTVLEDVSLHVDTGEFVGLVGPNGAGKTTLLGAITDRIEPDFGDVTIDGNRVADLSARETSRRVSAVHQDTSVQFAFDVETIVAMGRTPHRSRLGGDPDGHAHVERALERTDVADLRDRRISEISGGERQRVFLARALAQDSPALLLDEPTASLDVNHAARTLSLVRSLVEDGKAAIGAIHDLEAAARYCDRLVLLADGAVVAQGPPAQVLSETNVARAFDTESVVGTNPVTGTPTVTALPPEASLPTTVGDSRRVHVLGGGPLGARVIRDLWAAGHQVSCGPLPTGDVAATVGRSLDVDVVTTPGLATPPDAVQSRARECLEEASVTVLADPIVSPGLPLLSLARSASNETVLVEDRPLTDRNFAGGEGERTYRTLRKGGTVVPMAAVATAVEAPDPSDPVIAPTD